MTLDIQVGTSLLTGTATDDLIFKEDAFMQSFVVIIKKNSLLY